MELNKDIMKIATINYTYGGELVSISSGNEEDGSYQELKLDSDPLVSIDQQIASRNTEIKEYVLANGITHVEDRYYSARTGIYLCPVKDYLIEMDSYL